MANLKEVDLSRCVKVTNAGIRHLLSISTLEKLRVSETGVTADGIALLASLSNLSMLDLGGLPVNDKALNSLQVLFFFLNWYSSEFLLTLCFFCQLSLFSRLLGGNSIINLIGLKSANLSIWAFCRSSRIDSVKFSIA